MLISAEHKTAQVDIQTIRTLETSLVMQVLKLFSIVARSDQWITENERKFVADYCRQMFPQAIAEYLYERFQDYLKTHVELETVTDSINAQMAYPEKLFCLLKIYKLALAGQIEPRKLELIRQSADMIGVASEDLAYIENIFGLAEASGRPGNGSSIIGIRITDDPALADVYLPFNGLNLLVIKMYNLYCLFKPEGDTSDVLIDGFRLRENMFTRITHNADILINHHTIKFQDLKIFFENKVHGITTDLYLSQKGDGLSWETSRGNQSSVRVVLDGSLIWVENLKNDLKLSVNGANGYRNENVYLNLGDEIAINNAHFNVREVFFLLNREKEILLDREKTQYEITNDPLGDIFIADDYAEKWTVKLFEKNGGFTISKGDCPYQLKVDGNALVGEAAIERGSHIFLNNRSFRFDVQNRRVKQAYSTFEKSGAKAINRAFFDGPAAGREASVDIAYGDLVCVMGAGGCGRSALTRIVNGFCQVNQGPSPTGEFLAQKECANLKDHLGFVPREDVLLGNLTVYQNLYYYAKLRFPERTRPELKNQVELVLQDIGLADKRNLKVGGIGRDGLTVLQRKKLNIGLELLANVEVYLLDEPTIGLSLKESESIVELLANIAAQGKIVLAVVQQPGPNIFKIFDKMIVMDEDGRLDFMGTTQSALAYFHQHESYSHPHNELECPFCKTVHPKIVPDRRNSTLRDIDGTRLDEKQNASRNGKRPKGQPGEAITDQRVAEKLWEAQHSFKDRTNQFVTLIARNFSRKIRDRSNLVITFLGAPVLGIGVGMVTRFSPNDSYSLYYNDLFQTYLFVAVIVAMFFGMTNSIDEIITDRPVFRRDRILNLQNRSYLAAKVVVLLGFAVLQNALFTVAAFYVLEVRELYLHHIVFLSLVSWAGIALGLLISSIPNISSKAAQNLIVLVLIPQIILGGSLIVYEQMNKELRLFKESPIPEICQLMPSRWAHEGLMVMQAEFNSFDEEYDRLGRLMNEYKRERPKLMDRQEYLTARHGEKYFKDQKKALQEKIDSIEKKRNDFMATSGMKYGNAAIHNKVALASVAFKNEENSVYSLMIRKKKLPFIGKEVSTTTYNALAILSIIAVLLTINLFMLRFRNGVGHHINRFESIFGSGCRRTFSIFSGRHVGAFDKVGIQNRSCNLGVKKAMGSKARSI